MGKKQSKSHISSPLKIAILGAIAMILAALIQAIIPFILTSFDNNSLDKQTGEELVTIPNVVNYRIEKAVEELQKIDIEAKITEEESEIPSGTIIRQSPNFGSKAKRGITVTLITSKGLLGNSYNVVETILYIPEVMVGAEILVDDKPALIVKAASNIITIRVKKKSTNHVITLKKGNRTCSVTVLISDKTRTLFPCSYVKVEK